MAAKNTYSMFKDEIPRGYLSNIDKTEAYKIVPAKLDELINKTVIYLKDSIRKT